MAAVTSTGTSSGDFNPWLANDHWAGGTLTYSFPFDGLRYDYMSAGSVTPLSISQKNAVRQVLEEISGFTGLDFVEVTESVFTEGDLRFATDIDESGAYAYLPSSIAQGGDAFFGSVTDNPNIGNEAYLYFTHEIGHTLGLNHGHEYQTFIDTGFDSQEYTVVTYSDFVGDTEPFSFDSGLIDWAHSYMQLDIAAMQFLYGANYSTTGQVWSGDTTYSFDPLTGEMSINGAGQGTPAGNRIFRTIWDGDGEDTYDLSNYGTDLVVDLAPGGWLVLSDTQLADLNRQSTDTAFNAIGNVANALLVNGDNRALIENAIGGAGDDKVLGNDADNRLQGKGGRDELYGENGADILIGNSGRDRLFGGRDDDTLNGGAGHDRLFAGRGLDELLGGSGNDRLFGGARSDTLSGNGGDDRLNGGLGKDTLTGGSGADTFVFSAVAHSKFGSNSDRITDFNSGVDVIDLSGLVSGPLDLSIGGSFSGTGPSALVKISGNDMRVLVDVDGDSLADFRVILDGVTSVSASDFVL
ncbi:MAG: M10 family metallopeptidase C-terminal domain-containing protein [Rhodobacteraceae bacterium]|nr:M10 family metallopeptidase C-terminal domain-containing protein [Paracoccaceae bacterium]